MKVKVNEKWKSRQQKYGDKTDKLVNNRDEHVDASLNPYLRNLVYR